MRARGSLCMSARDAGDVILRLAPTADDAIPERASGLSLGAVAACGPHRRRALACARGRAVRCAGACGARGAYRSCGRAQRARFPPARKGDRDGGAGAGASLRGSARGAFQRAHRGRSRPAAGFAGGASGPRAGATGGRGRRRMRRRSSARTGRALCRRAMLMDCGRCCGSGRLIKKSFAFSTQFI